MEAEPNPDFALFCLQQFWEFENEMKLEYTGDEDDIIKKIELGNVNLPLSGSLITGAQSLFGVKTKMQFGKTTLTTVFSEQKSETSSIEIQGGAQMTDFELSIDILHKVSREI